MDCQHGHHHAAHSHQHHELAEGLSQASVRRLRQVFVLACLYLVLQVLGSLWSGSLALLAEAGHKLGDVSAIALALLAAWVARLPAGPKTTFGYGRMEVLAAGANALLLLMVAAHVLKEALERSTGGGHHHVDGMAMLGVAAVSLIINGVAVRILHPSKGHNINVKGAYLHVMADLAGSAGAIVSAALIAWLHWWWMDLVLSGLIAVMVLANAVHILADALHVLLEAAPRQIDVAKLEGFLLALPAVVSVHDLHVWSITTGKDALLAHVVVPAEAFAHTTVNTLEEALRKQYGFCHITLQLEPEGFTEAASTF